MTRSLVPSTLAILLGASLAACDGVAPVDPEAGVEVASAEELAAYRDAWVSSGVEDYRLRFDVLCFCTPTTVEVRVENGLVVEGAPETPSGQPLTILDLYDAALDAYPEADRVTVRVRPGPVPIPVSVSIDQSEAIADEEVTYAVRAFERD